MWCFVFQDFIDSLHSSFPCCVSLFVTGEILAYLFLKGVSLKIIPSFDFVILNAMKVYFSVIFKNLREGTLMLVNTGSLFLIMLEF